MSEVTIDSLVVKLGLDAAPFNAGLKSSTAGLEAFATKALGLIGLGLGIDKIIGYFERLHHQLAEVGFESRKLGVSATEISKWGEVATLAGGQASDAASNIESFQSAVFGLRFQGQMTESLAMLQRFGVAYLDASGHARSFRDTAMDAARAIQNQARAAGLNQGERLQMALHMGFTGGIATAVSQGGAGLEKALNEASVDQKALTQRTIDGQVRLSQALTRNTYVQEAANSLLLDKFTPAIEKLNDLLTKIDEKLVPLILRLTDYLENVIGPILTNIAEYLSYWFKDHSKDQIQDAKSSPLVNPDWMQRMYGRALVWQYNKGVDVTKPGLRAPTDVLSRVQAWTGDAITTFRALNDLHDKLGAGKDVDWTQAIAEYNRQIVKGVAHPAAPAVAPQTGLAFPMDPRMPRSLMTSPGTAPSSAPPTSMNGGPGTNITFENVNVYGRGHDGATLARDFESRIQRGYLVSNSDPGMVS